MIRRDIEDYGNIHEWIFSEEFCAVFCRNCSAVRYVKGSLEEPGECVCDVCGFDISDDKCLKSSERDRVLEAADYFCGCAAEALNHEGYEKEFD